MTCKECAGLGLDHYGNECYCEEGIKIEEARFKREYKRKKSLEFIREVNKL